MGAWFDDPALGRCHFVPDGAGILDDVTLTALADEAAEPLTIVRHDAARVCSTKEQLLGFARLLNTPRGRVLILVWDRRPRASRTQ